VAPLARLAALNGPTADIDQMLAEIANDSEFSSTDRAFSAVTYG
jgi:hypothetical protein